jgi:hypothetical protein
MNYENSFTEIRTRRCMMKNKWLKLGTLAVAVAAVALIALGGAAYAQGPGGDNPAPMFGRGYLMGFGRLGAAGPQNSFVAIAAKELGMEQTALVAELNAGKTLADVAKEKGVATDKLVEAFIAPRVQVINNAVAAKQITQAQADTLIASLKAHALAQLSQKFTARGYGMGLGLVDANNDGICDNCGAQQPLFQQFGRGGRWNR